MKNTDQDQPEHVLGLNDFAFILFKRKGTILSCTLLGLIAAVAVYLLMPPPYESQSKLLLRYVLDRSMVDPQESEVKLPDATYNENLIASEKEILGSWDLASQVAQSLANEGLIQGTKTDLTQATRNFAKGLSVTGSKGTNVIAVSYKDPNPVLAQRALESLINWYFVKHLEVHRAATAFDYVSRETAQVEERLKQIDSELSAAKASMGLISLKEATENLDAQIAKAREGLYTAEEETVAQRARVKELDKLLGSAETVEPPSTTSFQGNKKDLRTYQNLALGLTTLRQKQLELLARFTPESQFVKTNQAQIGALESQQKEMEKKFPGLLASGPDAGGRLSLFERNPQLDLIAERANLAALQEKTGLLRVQLEATEDRAKRFAEMAPKINKLETQKALEEANYKYFKESLDKAKVDEALDPTKIPNISVVQKPTPATRAQGGRSKLLLGLSAGGCVFGLGLALLLELVFDRSLKRPTELEYLNIPRLISIPDFSKSVELRRAEAGSYALPSPATTAPPPPEPPGLEWTEAIRPYGEALRDRLSLYFQLKNMARRPKLVAVTGCEQGAGTSTVAMSLAAAYSRIGKVLLVDMNEETPKIQTNVGKAKVYTLAEAVHPEAYKAMNGANLCFASATSTGNGSVRIIPKEFYEMIPSLRESQFECIVFDMSPLGPTSSTLAMAAFMDKLLLVVEAEVTGKECLKRVYEDLVSARADVGAVFNKTRCYGPRNFQFET